MSVSVRRVWNQCTFGLCLVTVTALVLTATADHWEIHSREPNEPPEPDIHTSHTAGPSRVCWGHHPHWSLASCTLAPPVSFYGACLHQKCAQPPCMLCRAEYGDKLRLQQ